MNHSIYPVRQFPLRTLHKAASVSQINLIVAPPAEASPWRCCPNIAESQSEGWNQRVSRVCAALCNANRSRAAFAENTPDTGSDSDQTRVSHPPCSHGSTHNLSPIIFIPPEIFISSRHLIGQDFISNQHKTQPFIKGKKNALGSYN